MLTKCTQTLPGHITGGGANSRQLIIIHFMYNISTFVYIIVEWSIINCLFCSVNSVSDSTIANNACSHSPWRAPCRSPRCPPWRWAGPCCSPRGAPTCSGTTWRSDFARQSQKDHPAKQSVLNVNLYNIITSVLPISLCNHEVCNLNPSHQFRIWLSSVLLVLTAPTYRIHDLLYQIQSRKPAQMWSRTSPLICAVSPKDTYTGESKVDND